jgi:hypothetical protein
MGAAKTMVMASEGKGYVAASEGIVAFGPGNPLINPE